MNSKTKIFVGILVVGIVLIGGRQAWSEQISPETQKQVTITTDKTEYEQGETVKVVLKNNLDKPVFLESCNPVILQLKDGSKWKELSRKYCEATWVRQRIKPGENGVVAEFDTGYEWEGKKLFPIGSYRVLSTYHIACTEDCLKGTVEEGRYGVRCIIKKTSRYAGVEVSDEAIILGLHFCTEGEMIYSNEFTIKGK